MATSKTFIIIMALPEFYQRYISNYQGESLVRELMIQGDQALDFYRSISESYSEHRYAPGKWSIQEVLAHVIDAERIFAARMLRFARNDSTSLPGFDENQYAGEMNIENRKYHDLINELANVRASTTDLVNSFNMEMLQRSGEASGNIFSVEQICKVIIGHEMHHRRIIEERYLD